MRDAFQFAAGLKRPERPSASERFAPFSGLDPVGGQPQGRTVAEVIAEAKAAAKCDRVVEPWEPLADDRIMWMNLNSENLFLPEDDPTHDDIEFTQARGYTDAILDRHLSNIAELVKSLNGGQGPDGIKLSEVEDRRVLEKLVADYLPDLGYQTVVLLEGHDRRGIDVGLISKFAQWPGTQPRLVLAPGLDEQRGILRVELDEGGRRCVEYVVHWKSMRDGEKVAAEMNSEIAAALKADIEATVAADPGVNIAVGGDFNTKFYKGNQTAFEALGVCKSPEGVACDGLFDGINTIAERRAEGIEHPLLPAGSHGNEFLDRALYNGTLLDGSGGMKVDLDSLVVVPTPGRFFGKKNRVNGNGISDHRPVVEQRVLV